MTAESVALITRSLEREVEPDPARALVAWDNLRNGRERIGHKVLAAAAQLARENVALLIYTLCDRKRASVASVTLSLREAWSDDLGTAWLTSAPTHSMRALGMQAWLRRIADTSPTREDSLRSLRLLQVALSAHATADVAELWWQALSIAGRYENRRAGGSFVGALYEIAAEVVADTGAIPTDQELADYQRTNSSVAAVLPYAALLTAQRGDDEMATRADKAFRREVRRVITTQDAYLSLNSICGWLYLESCSLAIIYSSDADWWVPIVKQALGLDRPWRTEPSYEYILKAAWLLTAAAIAVDRVHRETGQVRADILKMVTSIFDRHLSLLFWDEASDNREFWLYCSKVLARVLAIDPTDGPRRIVEFAAEVPSPEMMCEVLKSGGPVLGALELKKLVYELRMRMDFYRELQSDSLREP